MADDQGQRWGLLFVQVLASHSRHSPNNPEYRKIVEETLIKLKSVDHAVSVTSPYTAEKMIKGKTAYATVNFDRSFGELKESIKQIKIGRAHV